MHARRPPSSLQRNLNFDEQRNLHGLNSNVEALGPSYANGYDASPYQSTPRKQDNATSPSLGFGKGQTSFGASKPYVSAISRSTNQIPQRYSNSQPNATYMTTRSPSPVKAPTGGTSPSRYTDMENSTIQRQRRELQLLMNELKDRDRELNEMVDSHQKQLISWETDRKRVLVLEKQLPKYKVELKKRIEQIKLLKERLKIAEQNAQSKTKELEATQMHLQQASDQANISTHQAEELKDRNENMARSIQELSTSLGQLQAKEQELVTTLNLKENDMRDANTRLNDLTNKVKSLHSSLQECRKSEAALRTERDQWKEQFQANKHEVEQLRADINNQYNNVDEHQAELSQVKQELLTAQKELFLAGEREKRKDQLIELSKSKQERTETELHHLRQLYERQQREMMFLQQQVQSQEPDISDRLSELNTDDDISDISSVINTKLKSKATDNGLDDIDNFVQDNTRSFDLAGLYQRKDATSLGAMQNHSVAPRSVRVKSPAVDQDNSGSQNGSYLDYSTPKANNDSTSEKLHKLLEESRKMVNSLEAASPLSSISSTPETKDMRNRSTEESFTPSTDKKRRSPMVLSSFDAEEV